MVALFRDERLKARRHPRKTLVFIGRNKPPIYFKGGNWVN
jgi:hypothetical protein